MLHFGLFDLGLTHLRRGDATHATRILERCLDVRRTSRIVVAIPIAAAALGAASALVDRLDAALPLVEESVEEFHARPLYRRPGLILVLAGMTYLRAGRIDEAVGCAGEALALTRRLGRGEARPMLSPFQVRSPRSWARAMPKATTVRRWRSQVISACARSWPTATSASASSTGGQENRSKRSSISFLRR